MRLAVLGPIVAAEIDERFLALAGFIEIRHQLLARLVGNRRSFGRVHKTVRWLAESVVSF